MTAPVVLLRLERPPWGYTVLQRIGDGVHAQLELRAFTHDGKSKGVTIMAAELRELAAHCEHEANTLLGHPKHQPKGRA